MRLLRWGAYTPTVLTVTLRKFISAKSSLFESRFHMRGLSTTKTWHPKFIWSNCRFEFHIPSWEAKCWNESIPKLKYWEEVCIMTKSLLSCALNPEIKRFDLSWNGIPETPRLLLMREWRVQKGPGWDIQKVDYPGNWLVKSPRHMEIKSLK